MAEVKPHHLQKEKQLEKEKVDCSQELSAVRIHIERIIGLLKQKYTIYFKGYYHTNSITILITECLCMHVQQGSYK